VKTNGWHATKKGDYVEIDLGCNVDVKKVNFYNRHDNGQAFRADKAVIQLLDAQRREIGKATLNGDLAQTKYF